MLNILRTARASRIRRDANALSALEQKLTCPRDVAEWQLNRLNQIWRGITQQVPYYQRLANSGLPASFESLDQFSSLVPITERDHLQGNISHRMDASQPVHDYRSTGGSTAEPIRFPCGRSETAAAAAAAWHARARLGITPADRLFLLWGHSHLFGTGWGGRWRRWKRQLADAGLGYCRWSAYDLSPPALRRAAMAMLKFRPQYVVGYSVALDRFARANEAGGAELRQLGLKAVIATAEAFPAPDSRERLHALFNCPVLMEYGSVETGVLAHEVQPEKYETNWQHFFIEAVPSPHRADRCDLLVTSLVPRCLPLVRYRLGDQIDACDAARPLLRFRRVAGRCNDVLQLASGRIIHSEAIAHIVRDFADVHGYQLICATGEPIRLQLQTQQELPTTSRQRILERLTTLDPELSQVELCEVAQLQKSIAGKTPTIIYLPTTGNLSVGTSQLSG